MPVPAQITSDLAVVLLAHGQVDSDTLFGNAGLDDWLMLSEAHLISPDPPPRNIS